MITRRGLAAVLLSLLPLAASAQVRIVPAETGVAPLGAPAGAVQTQAAGPSLSLSAPSLNGGPSLSGSLSAPSLSQPLSVPVLPAALPSAFAARPVPAAAVAVVPSVAVEASAPAALAAKTAAAASIPGTRTAPAALGALQALAERPANAPVQGAELDALFDGARPLPSAASTPEGPRKRPLPALTPKEVRRAKIALVVGVPAAAALAVTGALAPHLALAGLHLLGQAAYWLANPFAFLFTVPQIHRMISRRSAAVSKPMMAVGLVSTVLMALNMAYDGKDLMLYRNLAQALGFALMIGLAHRYSRGPAKAPPSKRRAIVETVAASLALTALLPLIGPFLAAAIPGVALMGSLLVPIQVVSGFGFTYLMYAQLSKMRREQSAGDSSPAMMWAYLGTKTIWVWSLATMLSLVTAPPWMTLSAAALFVAVCWLAGRAALSRLLRAPWGFLPEKVSFRGRTLSHAAMSDILAFVVLSALIGALSAGAYFAFAAAMGVPAAMTSRFVMYLLYTVQSYVACLATMKSLRERARLDKK